MVLPKLDFAINLQKKDRPQFEISHVECGEVRQLMLMTLSGVHSAGPDLLSSSIIKLLTASLAPALTKTFNYSIENTIFPTEWNKAFLKPLLKISAPRSPSDTRPIANLCEFSKLLERLVHKQIVKYLDEHNIMDPFQSGYRKKYSTQTALLKLCHDIRKAADNRHVTILVLFDFSKAFDMVSHARLLSKLARLGFSSKALAWMFSYLTDHEQCVIDNSTMVT